MVDARTYHEESAHSPQQLRAESFRLDHANKPRPSKIYDGLQRVEGADPEPPGTPVLEAIASPRATPSESAPDRAGDPHLPTLCHYATGVTKELTVQGRSVRYRAAPCTGKLYHVDLYAVTGECGGFDPGVYHFDPDTGGFDVLRQGDYRGVLAAAAGEYGPVADAPLTVVATSEWWRNAWKYRDRTYRHAFWDSGTILANLLAVAHGSGHRAEVVTGFADDPITALLGLDPDEEAPLELVPVGAGATAPEPVESVEPIDPAETPLSEKVIEYPLVPEAWRQSRLADGEATLAWRDRFGTESGDMSLDSRSASGGERVDLEPVDADTASARPVAATIERRGSLREYNHDDITRAKFATVLDRALRGTPSDCFARTDLSGLVDYYCLVHAVEGIDQGVYEYHPGTNDLEWVHDTDRETAGHLALDQGVVGDAAVNLYTVADVDAIVDRFGNRGYRLAQLEGGLALGRLYLATYAHLALGGRGFTFYDGLVSEYLSPHADGQQPMTLFAFGAPPA
jgi:SagB-type dehydrogenase family enzyme